MICDYHSTFLLSNKLLWWYFNNFEDLIDGSYEINRQITEFFYLIWFILCFHLTLDAVYLRKYSSVDNQFCCFCRLSNCQCLAVYWWIIMISGNTLIISDLLQHKSMLMTIEQLKHLKRWSRFFSGKTSE